ncbi:MAG: oligopeptide transporter, OPT family [candidate division Zixibacteria bacterium]|nr:oligopeptide transporter, OPT family [candidate division Zixibacteria bacterium]
MPNQDNNSSPNSKKFEPYIKASQIIPEVTIKALVLGAIISVVFGVANAYLALKFGMTVSASIPAAVISMAVLRSIYSKKNVTVLENNIVQTVGSAGESLAAGITFTIPAFFIWAADTEMIAMGYMHEVSKTQIFWMSMLGGSLGILLMIPLRKYLVDKEHGKLKFPEGTACAEIITAGDEGGSKAKTVFMGLGLGAVYKALMVIGRFWNESPGYDFKGLLKGGTIGIDASPALVGVGYIIGPRIASLMLAGAVMGYLGISPLLAFIGEQIPGLIISPGDIPLSDMNPAQLRNSYIKYLGVGAVAFGGTISLVKSIPTIISSFSSGFRQLFNRGSGNDENTPRTDRDIPMSVVLIGALLIVTAVWLLPGTELHFLGALLAVLFGFFFVVVSARIVGLIGSSSNPVSGMTIFTLLVTCMILLQFGIDGVNGMITAMSVGTVVCIAVCMSGDIAQDLKTGYLLGATPRLQQWTEFVGLFFPALAMGLALYLLGDAFGWVETVDTPNPLEAPQANVMATIVKGVIGGNIPWTPIIVGAFLALGIELLGINSLPVAIGLYLPISLSTPLMLGGLVAGGIKKITKGKELFKKRQENGILFASGLVAGGSLIGVLSAGLIAGIPDFKTFCKDYNDISFITGEFGQILSLIMVFGLAFTLFHVAKSFGKK